MTGSDADNFSGRTPEKRIREHFQMKETIVTIMADDRSFIETAKEEILKQRTELESFIFSDPYFESTLEPWPCVPEKPEIVRRMTLAGNAAGIGPMSAVAGTIAAFAVAAMVRAGASFALVDNGGDIAVYNPASKGNGPLTIGIYAGSSSFKDLGFRIPPTENETIFGVCTSSGTVGPSISFGNADAAIIFSKSVPLADSAATALGNAYSETDTENLTDEEKTDRSQKLIEKALNEIRDFRIEDKNEIPGNTPLFSVSGKIDGAVLIKGKNIGIIGDVPEFVRADVRWDIITKARIMTD